jgi:oligosaccharyltransferase complex subunit alpha (ribophorin I)
LVITYHILNVLKPLPATIGQNDKQYLSYEFSEYAHSAYDVNKQKTKIKFPGVDIPDWTGKPEKQGSSFTYGAFDNVPAGAESMQSVRYEFTKPLIYTSHLERDIEISQWGGNAAFEDRYWLTNKGAELSNQFSRVAWAGQQYYNAPTSAIKEFRVPLKAGAVDAYFTDEVGNISTSHFRSSKKESLLELKPRYPVFGGWNFPFKIGYNAPLSNFLRLVKGESYILKVPFLEGPKQIEGVAYERVTLRVILPEGAINVKYQTELPLVDAAYSSHKTFFDTLGRTTLTLTAMNVVDESREVPLVITYDYPFSASFRKPITLFMGVLAVFAASWLVTSVDTSIGKKA